LKHQNGQRAPSAQTLPPSQAWDELAQLGTAVGRCEQRDSSPHGLPRWLSLVILFLMSCYVYGRRVKAEEKALLGTIGEPYRAYMAQTKRFIPFIF
jgi:hypothetical protein